MNIQYYRICVHKGLTNGALAMSDDASSYYIVACNQDSDDGDVSFKDVHACAKINEPDSSDEESYTFRVGHNMLQILEEFDMPEYMPIVHNILDTAKRLGKVTIGKRFVHTCAMEDGVEQNGVIPYFIGDNTNEAMSLNATKYSLMVSSVKVYRLINKCYVPVPEEENVLTVYFMNCVNMPVMVSRIGFTPQGMKLVIQGGKVVRITPERDNLGPVLNLCAKINATIGAYRTLVNHETTGMYINTVDGIELNLMALCETQSKDMALSYATNLSSLINNVFKPVW